MSRFVETARPKINLTLQILGRRSDGYHALESLVAFAEGPCDCVTLDCDQPASISTQGPFASGISGANLLQTVLQLVVDAASRADLDEVRLGLVHLEKHLPVAAGVGGGSADAAALIRALQKANPSHAHALDWRAIALRLGADVPVCLFNRAAWMTGIGEHLTALENLPPLPALLVNPQVAVPADKTARVFHALQAGDYGESTPRQVERPNISNPDALIAMIDGGNDLQTAAIAVVPTIDEVLKALRALPNCRVAAMSGAGPTCFAVFDGVEAAAAAAIALQRDRPGWWIAPVMLG
ncbi:MAG: 4-(cytidine 5'-diphospho)-2-C-methyl-D-erythritol kinase [Hyphomicrobiaceae bacterium]